MAPCAIDSVAFLGNHTPRQCGIATFTADLASAVQALSASRQGSGGRGVPSWKVASRPDREGSGRYRARRRHLTTG